MLQASSDSETGPPTLISIALDLQIIICTLLHPSDILALRETCKALQLATRQRVVWVAALHRVCLDNSLFLPSFPIPDMSDAELEHAALAPCRCIERCVAFERQHHHDLGATLHPRRIRVVMEDSLATSHHPDLIIVPGGRYMVSCSYNGVFVWDLGYTSSADFKLISSVRSKDGLVDGYYTCMVQATPDGMGLVILCSLPFKECSVYEIYPQSETPQLTRIAHLDPDRRLPMKPWACLLPDRLIWNRSNGDSIIFSVWDYRMNYSVNFAGDVDFNNLEYYYKVIATKTEIFLLGIEEILVWAIPPLLPQPPGVLSDDPIHIPPLFRIAYPDGIVDPYQFVASQTMFHWYYGTSQSLYFGILCAESKLHKFEIIVKPDLFDTSLHFINTELVPYDFREDTYETYSICEDTFFTCWKSEHLGQFRVLASPRFATVIPHGGSAATVLLSWTASGYHSSLCPASGRCLHFDMDTRRIFVVDLF